MNLSTIRRIKDPAKRAAAAEDYLREQERKAGKYVTECRDERDKAVLDMLKVRDADGKQVYRQADIARTLGISRSAVAQRFAPADTRPKPKRKPKVKAKR